MQDSKGKRGAPYFPNFSALKARWIFNMFLVFGYQAQRLILLDFRDLPCEWLHVGSSP